MPRLTDFGPGIAVDITTLQTLATQPGVWQTTARETLTLATSEFSNTDAAMRVMHIVQRLRQVNAAGLWQDQSCFDAIAAMPPATWDHFSSPDAAFELQSALADKLYNGRPGTDDYLSITLSHQSRIIGPLLLNRCRDDAVPFIVHFDDVSFRATLINHADDHGIRALAQEFLDRMAPINRLVFVGAGLSDIPPIKTEPGKDKIMADAMAPYRRGETFYTLTRIPTRKDAEIDNIPYPDYITLFFEMCDQPWDAISRAQTALISEFDAAKIARFTNDDGTDLTMDITGFTFANSLIAKNVPGSEIFSAPRRDSTNGKIVAKGLFTHGGKLIENLTLEFENGQLVRYTADRGLDDFTKIIGVDEGARHLGEIGIGTNPHLKRHVSNGLLVEKIGGSFHVALGAAYTYTDYMGTPVKLDNGNKSKLHWDITTMLYGKGGTITLDGRTVMKDGLWIGDAYDVLNRGWAAIPADDRPEYWKNYHGHPLSLQGEG